MDGFGDDPDHSSERRADSHGGHKDPGWDFTPVGEDDGPCSDDGR